MPTSEAERLAFEAGDYAQFYVSTSLFLARRDWLLGYEGEPTMPERRAFTAGFYASFELHEIPEVAQDSVAEWREAHPDA